MTTQRGGAVNWPEAFFYSIVAIVAGLTAWKLLD